MNKPKQVHPRKVVFFVFVLSLTTLCLGGCATTGSDDDNGSDLPWNTPQPWEGAPSIPGMNGMGR
jgi:hypothetical protein